MITRSIFQFLISYIYIFFECHYFALDFILILCHLQFTGYEDRTTLLRDYIILGFSYYNIKIIDVFALIVHLLTSNYTNFFVWPICSPMFSSGIDLPIFSKLQLDFEGLKINFLDLFSEVQIFY